MAEFTYGFNIKRDRHIAENAQAANSEKYIARLKNFGEKNNIETRLFAMAVSLKSKSGEVKTENVLQDSDMMTAQKILRDMYGIIHYYITGDKNLKRVNTIGKFLKTFNRNIKVYFVARQGEDIDGILDLNAVDSVITVTNEELKKAQSSVLTTEKLTVSDSDAAVLYAAAKVAKQAKNKRRNALAVLSDECTTDDTTPDEDEDEKNDITAENLPAEQAADSDAKNAEDTESSPQDKTDNSAE